MASRQAPALLLQIPPERGWRRLNRLLEALAAGVLLGMPGLHLGWPGWLPGLLVGMALLAGAAWPLRLPAPVRLRWDGAQWWWRDGPPADPGERAVDLTLHIDLGHWMLLGHAPAGAPWRLWAGGHLAVSRRGLGPQAWAGFRQRLLLARAG